MKKRFLSLILSLALVVSSFPVATGVVSASVVKDSINTEIYSSYSSDPFAMMYDSEAMIAAAIQEERLFEEEIIYESYFDDYTAEGSYFFDDFYRPDTRIMMLMNMSMSC